MGNNLQPKHFAFYRWFVNIRWIAIVIVIITTFIAKNIFKISIQEIPIYILLSLLFIFNLIYLKFKEQLEKKEPQFALRRIKQILHFQISTDLIILTIILHYSGGIENPFIIYYIFHMIIASIIFKPIESFLQTCLALVLIGVLAFLECYSIIPHYALEGFVTPNLYQNKFYIFTTGTIFVTTSFMVVFLTTLIVSESRKNEEAYLKANTELEKKDKLKNEYVLHVTHDIIQHLAAIISLLSLVKSNIIGILNEKQKEFINRSYERTELLINFVKDLLNLTKKRMTSIEETKEFSIENLVSSVTSAIQINVKEKSILFDVYIDPDITNIIGNPFTLEEAFLNLLFNAIKYTQENGHVQLNIKNSPDDIIVEVSDTGIGIPDDEIQKVFDEFFRASNVKKDIKSGTGLGLSIVKQIIMNHKGRIWVESQLGIGTKFTFTLPKNKNRTEG